LRSALIGERHRSGRAVRARDDPRRAFALLRLVAFLIGGLLIGTIAGKLLTPGAQTDLAAIAPPARVERPCSPVSGKTAIIVVHGQSNAANYGSTRHTAREPSTISIPRAANALLQPIPCWAPTASAGALQRASATSRPDATTA